MPVRDRVILSPKFFSKDWPQRELDGLVARENASGQKAILPVWHRMTKLQVANFSPMLADRSAGNSKEGIPSLVRRLKEAMELPTRTQVEASLMGDGLWFLVVADACDIGKSAQTFIDAGLARSFRVYT